MPIDYTEDLQTKAFCIRIGSRFYYQHDKKKVLTSFSLAGAKLFVSSFSLNKVTKVLDLRSKSFKIEEVILNQQPSIIDTIPNS